jgi:hypothetical protein
MWTAVLDKNISMIDPINKAVLGVKSSDNSLCGGESHLRVKKMSVASDSNKVAIKAATERFTGMISTLTPALTMWTAVPDKNISMIDPINKAVLAVTSSDTSLCGGEAHLRVKKMSAASDSTKAVIGASVEIAIVAVILAHALTTWTAVPDKNKTNMNSTPIHSCKRSDSRLPARIPGKNWQISARISKSPQFSNIAGAKGTEGTPLVTLIAARNSGSTGTTGSRGCRRRVCSNEHAWANAPA